MLTRKQIQDDEAEIEAEIEGESGPFEERFERYCSMTDAELAADELRMNLELDRMVARERELLAKMSVPRRYAFERHECLRAILKSRMRIDRMKAVGCYFDFIEKTYAANLRKKQLRLLDLRRYRQTGIMPTGDRQ